MSDRGHGAGSGGAGAPDWTSLRERIRLLIELGRAKDAVRLVYQAAALGDRGAELAELEGLALIRMGEHKSALEALGRGLQLSPERAHLHYLRAFAERDGGGAELARAGLAEALRLAPEEPVYLRAYAELLSELGDHPRALELARQAVRCGPDRAANHVTLGFVASAAGDKPRARTSYEQALRIDPEDAAAWNNLGCLDLEGGDTPRARQRFREALRLAPEGQRARNNLSRTLEGRTLEGYAGHGDWLRGLAQELAAVNELGLLAALAFEAEEGREVFFSAARKPGRARAFAAVAGVSIGTVLGLMRRSGAAALVGAGLGLVASLGGRRWLRAERQRVCERLAVARPAFEQIRRAWLEGHLERQGRDAAARRLIEETVLALREPAPLEQENPV